MDRNTPDPLFEVIGELSYDPVEDEFYAYDDLAWADAEEAPGHLVWGAPDSIEVGPFDSPDGTSYRYRIEGRLSERTYHNAASARYDARRLQRVLENGRIEPVPEGA